MPLWKYYLSVVGASCPWLWAGELGLILVLSVAVAGVPMLFVIRAFDRAAQNVRIHKLPMVKSMPVARTEP